MLRLSKIRIVCAALISTFASSAFASEIYITNFSKDNNIYTNLNENFPNTGAGAPGTGVGVANSSYIYNPYTFQQSNGINGSDLAGNNGVIFKLTSNAAGQDFNQLTGGQTQSLTFGLNGITSVSFLVSAYFGTSFDVTFTGSSGTQTFNNISVPDFNGGGPINITGSNYTDQTVYRVQDVGAGGSGNSTTGAYNYYDLTEASFALSGLGTLGSATITSNGDTTLLLGVTASTSAVPEPSTWAMMLLGFAGLGFAGYRKTKRKADTAFSAA